MNPKKKRSQKATKLWISNLFTFHIIDNNIHLFKEIITKSTIYITSATVSNFWSFAFFFISFLLFFLCLWLCRSNCVTQSTKWTRLPSTAFADLIAYLCEYVKSTFPAMLLNTKHFLMFYRKTKDQSNERTNEQAIWKKQVSKNVDSDEL